MAGVHGLQQVERFRSAHFADDDAFRPHTQTVAHQIAHGDLALALEIGRPCLQPHHMRLLQLQFGGVLAGNDTLVIVDVAGQTIEQRRFAGAGAAGNEHIHTAAADHLEDFGAFRRNRSVADQLLECQLVLAEFADGERRPVDRQRRHDRVDTRTVRQTRVADRRSFVDAPADLTDDALTDIEQLLIVAKADAGLLNFAADFDIDRTGAVHHDVGDLIARQQWLERPVTENIVANIVEQVFLLGDRHHDVFDRDDLVDDVADFLARRNRHRAWRAGRDRWPRSERRTPRPSSRNTYRSGASRLRSGLAAAGLPVLRCPAAVPRRQRRPNYGEMRNAYQTRTQLRQTLTVTMAVAAASRSAVTTDWNSSFLVRCGRSVSAPIGAGCRRYDDWPIFRRSSGHCWRPTRIAAARME